MIYILLGSIHWEGNKILGAFSTREKAEAEAERLQARLLEYNTAYRKASELNSGWSSKSWEDIEDYICIDEFIIEEMEIQ